MNTLIRSLIISLSVFILTACGGGSNGSSSGSGISSGTAPDNTTAGSVIWDAKVTDAPIHGSAAIATDGTIYVFTQNLFVTGRLIALNPDGSKKWEFDVGADYVGSFSTPSIADDGTIYVGANNGLVAINPDGTGKWTYPVLSYANSPSIATDGTIYISESVGSLSAVNPDGSLKWTVSMGNNVNIKSHDGIAIAPNGTLYLSTDDGLVRSYTAAGVLRWTYNANRSRPHTPAISGDSGEIYVSYDDGFVVALSSNGVSKWTQDLGGNNTRALTFSSNNVIYAASGDFLYKISPVDGTAIWSYNAGNDIRTTPAIGDDEVIYFADVGGKLFAVNAQGTIEWFSDDNNGSLFNTEGSPVIGDNGIVYYPTGAGRVRAVGSSSTKPNTGCAMFMCNARHTGRF